MRIFLEYIENNKIILVKIYHMKNKPYHAFYKKRLNTESFLDTEMSTTNMSELTTKIIKSLKDANVQGSKRREKMQMAQSRIKTKQNQQAESRQKLREKLQGKMRLSQTNLQKINSQRKKSLSSRSQFEQSQRKKIKENEKKLLQSSLVSMYKVRKQTEKFFRQTQQKKQQQFERVQKIDRGQRTRYGSLNQSNYLSSFYPGETNDFRSNSTVHPTKPPIKVLKVSQAQIINKQKKKESLQIEKECKYLSEYMAKMQNIVNVRNKGTKAAKQPTATLPKVISRQRSSVSKKRISKSPQTQANIKNFTTDLKEQSEKKVSFSQMYLQKLNEKKSKKQIFHSLIMHEGDEILQKQYQRTKVLKQSKIIKQSLNEYKRWTNLVANYKNRN